MKILRSLHLYDLRGLLWFTHSKYHLQLSRYAKAISKTGDGYLQLLLPITLLLTDAKYGEVYFFTSAIAFAVYLPIYWFLKNSLRRKRPSQVIANFNSKITASDTFSFPSGHTAAAFLLANLTTSFYGAIAWPLYIWASLVGLSRVILGVHFPTDILAGIILGTSSTFFILQNINILLDLIR